MRMEDDERPMVKKPSGDNDSTGSVTQQNILPLDELQAEERWLQRAIIARIKV